MLACYWRKNFFQNKREGSSVLRKNEAHTIKKREREKRERGRELTSFAKMEAPATKYYDCFDDSIR